MWQETIKMGQLIIYMSWHMKKPVFWVSDQVRLKSAYSATEAS